jgi:TUP1-like enhancer of split
VPARAGAVVDLLAQPAVKAEVTLAIRVDDPGTGASTSAASSTVSRLVVASNAQRREAGSEIADVTCSQGGRVQWATCCHSHVTAMAGSASFLALALFDGTLRLLSPGGRRMLPPVALPAPVVLLAADGSKLLMLLTNGDVCVWDAVACKVRAWPSVA